MLNHQKKYGYAVIFSFVSFFFATGKQVSAISLRVNNHAIVCSGETIAYGSKESTVVSRVFLNQELDKILGKRGYHTTVTFERELDEANQVIEKKVQDIEDKLFAGPPHNDAQQWLNLERKRFLSRFINIVKEANEDLLHPWTDEQRICLSFLLEEVDGNLPSD